MIRPSICFVSHYAHAVFTGKSRQPGGVGAFGGAEIQQCLIARALAARGTEVAFVSHAAGPPREEAHEGVRFFTVPLSEGSAVHRFARTQIDFWRAMGHADASVYYQRCAGSLSGFVGLFARLHGRPFIFSVANDRDIDGRFIAGATAAEAAKYRLGVRLTSAIVVQSRNQLKLLREGWGREGVIIPSICPVDLQETAPSGNGGSVLWVGNLLPKKRPNLLLDLADALPEVSFTMIALPIGEAALVRETLDRIRSTQNVEYIEGVSYPEIPAYYRKAALLVSTSVAEGFPNVFLEAWARRLPVVSLEIDPDEVICERKLGTHAGTMEELIRAVKGLLGRRDTREEIGERARAYVREYHAPERVGTRYEDLLRSLLDGR